MYSEASEVKVPRAGNLGAERTVLSISKGCWLSDSFSPLFFLEVVVGGLRPIWEYLYRALRDILKRRPMRLEGLRRQIGFEVSGGFLPSSLKTRHKGAQ